ncbi:hypothetical protein MBBA_0882 [Methanoculleus bourgensis]|uniref:type IV pilin n=1 Tax=Methanoculleus bourgensis TaxID=83986 RepID=UPI0007BC86C2|nr:hypothetical protein MBBA_0882 [Methanoculleus bourgensis]
MIGVVLLVGVTVLAVAVVAALFLSGPQPDEIPHATIVAGNKSGNLTLAHEGGDPLRKGEYRIYVDTGSGLVDGTGSFSKPEGGVWLIGGALVYNGAGTPERVVVTAISGGSETILAEPEFVGRGEGAAGFSPDPVEPGVTVTPGPGGGGDVSPIQITTPEASQELVFSGKGHGGNKYATMIAQTSLENVTRIDFIIYRLDGPYTNDKETIMRAVEINSSDYYVWDGIPVLPGLSNGDKVAMVAIAYNRTKIIGCKWQVTTVTGI